MVTPSSLPLEGLWWKGSLFSLAGLLVNLAVLLICIFVINVFETFSFILWGIISYQGLVIIRNLVPQEFQLYGAMRANDGKLLLGYLRGDYLPNLKTWQEALGKTICRYDPNFDRNTSELLRPYSTVAALYFEAEIDLAKAELDSAVPKYLKVLDSNGLSTADKALVLDRLASLPIVQGAKKYLQDGLRWAKQSYDLIPQCKTILGTYGSLLIETGSYHEGIEMLSSLTTEDNDPLDRSISSCYIAKAYHHLGNSIEAKKWLKRGEEIGGHDGVFQRITEEIEKLPYC